MSEEFVTRMLNSYHKVHSKRYWKEVDEYIKKYSGTGRRFMDIGCGPGLHLLELLKRYSPDEVIGVDLSEAMLEKADEILREYKGQYTLIQRHLQDDMTLPEGIDVIFSSRVLRSFEDQYTTFSVINKSLKPGGLLILLDWARADIQTYEKYFRKEWEKDIPPSEIMMYHRNFSRYSLNDWEYILTHTSFSILKMFSLTPVHLVVIAQSAQDV